MSDDLTSTLQYGLIALLVLCITILVLFGHEDAQAVVVLGSLAGIGVGFLFRDAIGTARKKAENQNNGKGDSNP